MLGIFGRQLRSRRIAALYGRVVAGSRQQGFYAQLAVPDTIEGRYEMLVVHCYLVLRRLHALGRPAVSVSQDLFEFMLDDLDRSAREIGVGDMGIAKQMKRLGKGFYGRAAAYDTALNASDSALLAAALARNVLDSEAVMEAARGLATYVEAADVQLRSLDLNAVLAAETLFPSVNRTQQAAA
jgi:cytochrome b pre-mRNA-processing protein 3